MARSGKHNHGHNHGHLPGGFPDRSNLGHNHSHADHLHSHMHGDSARETAEELKELATSFVEGFVKAEDKTSYLRLAGIPFRITGSDGLRMNLVDASINSNWQIGTASPAFASRELVYMPLPGKMVQHRESMTFTYVSLTERRDINLVEFLKNKFHNGEHVHEH